MVFFFVLVLASIMCTQALGLDDKICSICTCDNVMPIYGTFEGIAVFCDSNHVGQAPQPVTGHPPNMSLLSLVRNNVTNVPVAFNGAASLYKL